MEPGAKREKEIFRVTWTGSVVNFMLLVFKFVTGIVGHSSAMIADAVHSLSDFITDIIVIFFVRISSKPFQFSFNAVTSSDMVKSFSSKINCRTTIKASITLVIPIQNGEATTVSPAPCVMLVAFWIQPWKKIEER